jgi:hypothetical protein
MIIPANIRIPLDVKIRKRDQNVDASQEHLSDRLLRSCLRDDHQEHYHISEVPYPSLKGDKCVIRPNDANHKIKIKYPKPSAHAKNRTPPDRPPGQNAKTHYNENEQYLAIDGISIQVAIQIRVCISALDPVNNRF